MKQLPAKDLRTALVKSSSAEKILPLLALIIGFFIFYRTWYQQIDHSLNWMDSYTKGEVFGQGCSYAIDTWQPHDTFTSAQARSEEFTNLKMPFRDAPAAVRPLVKQGQYIFTRCPVTIAATDKTNFLFVQLGNIFGDSAVFVDGELIHLQNDDGLVQFPVHPAWRQRLINIDILSKASPAAPVPGAGSLLPLVYTDSRETLDGMNRTYKFWSTEIPVFLLGYTLALFVFFSVIWVLGIRYPDVNWMLVLLALLSVNQFISYVPVGRAPRWTNNVSQCLAFSQLVTLAVFVIAFLRVKVSWRWREGLLFGTTSLYVLATYTLSQPMKRLLDLRLATPYYVAAFLFAVLTVVSFKHRRRLEGVRRTRVLIVTISVGLASLLCALQAVLARVNAWEFGDYVIYSFATLFAAFLAADLVVFQRQYFAERTKRAEQEAAKIQLEERLELGRSVQDILLPKKRTGSFRQFQYELFHIPAATMAGDWLYLWDASAQEKRVLFGDVMGKGPQAAIVVSAVMAFLYECRKRQLSVEQSIEYLNTSLSEIFYERTTSTFAAAVLYSDDQVDLYSCGTAGWFHATPRDVRHVAIRHQALGMGGKIKPEKVTIRMQAGNSLFSFSDGVLEGSRETKKLVALLGDYSSTKMSPSGLFNMACQVGGRQSGFDDQTMVVIKR